MTGWLQRLTNLLKINRPKSVKGQVMTLMILLLVVMLIFVLATFEIGDTSLRATKMANAADAAALELASNLATRGRMMADNLPCDPPRMHCCFKKAFWSIILTLHFGVPGAIVGNYLDGNPQSWYEAAYMGFKILLGALMIALGIIMIVGAIVAMIGSGGSCSYACVKAIIGGIMLITGGVLMMYKAMTGFNKKLQAGLNQVARMFANLDDKSRWRETAIYSAMNRLVTDQNMARDLDDMDADGDTVEKMPDFAHWWYKRTELLVQDNANKAGAATTFVKQMSDFQNRSSCVYEGRAWCGSNERELAPLETVAGYASRQSVPVLQKSEFSWIVNEAGEDEAVSTLNGLPIPDGRIIRLTRAMENAGVSAGSYLSLPIYQNGPTASAMNNYAELECCPPGFEDSTCSATCPTPTGYDWMDELSEGLREINMLIAMLNEEPSAAEQWPYWIGFFYNSADLTDADTIYGQLGMYLDALRNFQTSLTYLAAPACRGGWYARVCTAGVCTNVCGDCPVGVYRYVWRGGRMERIPVCGNCVDARSPHPSWPCRLTIAGGFNTNSGITLTEVPTDVVPPIQRSLSRMISLITTFRTNIARQASLLTSDSAIAARLASYGGLSPTYSWTDSRGRKSIRVEVGDFLSPRYRKRKTWRKTCIYLLDYADDGSASGGRCWVKVTQVETPANGLGILGAWNPFRRSMDKTSRATYSVNRSDDSANIVGINAVN